MSLKRDNNIERVYKIEFLRVTNKIKCIYNYKPDLKKLRAIETKHENVGNLKEI